MTRCPVLVLQPDEALSDDFLFPMTSRLSYASSPESDLDLSPEPRPHAHSNSGLTPGGHSTSRLVKSSSDPSIATVEDGAPGYTAPPPYSPASPYNKQVCSRNAPYFSASLQYFLNKPIICCFAA